MNKKKIFGVPLAVVVIGLVALGGATAALVTYLSNSQEVQVSVESPLLVEASSDGESFSTDPLNVGGLYGGDTFTYTTRVTNRASVDVNNVDLEVVISNEGGNAACGDFSALTVTSPTGPSPIDALEYCTNNEDGTATVTLGAQYHEYEVESYGVSGTFQVAVSPDTYTFTTTARPQTEV